MRKLLFRKPAWATLALAVLAALVFSIVALSGSPWAAAQIQRHGVSIAKGCVSPSKVGDTTLCEIELGYNDDFGDTIMIVAAWDVQDSGGDNVRVPAVGDLPIVAVDGNTTCTVGGSLPCNIGEGGSTLDGLPGDPDDGLVVFRQDTYVIQADDPNPLPDKGNVQWKDLCDAPGTSGCNPVAVNTAQAPAATDLVHPGVSVSKSGPDVSKDGDTVTYTIEVCNTGDVDLIEDSIVDTLLGDLADSYDDNLVVGECE